jgi:putative MATE family efflux protein
MGFGIILLVFGLIFKDPLVRLLGATENNVQYTKDYADYVLLAAPFFGASYVLNASLRSEGSAFYAMTGTLIGAVINIGLDPLFIFVFGWGIKGASAATAISKFISFAVLLYPYLKKSTILRLSIKYISYTKEIVLEVIRMGSPSLLRSGMATFAMITINSMAGRYSDSALAALSVVNRIAMLILSVCIGFGPGVQPVAGYNYGAKRYDRVLKSFKFAVFSGVIGISVLAGIVAVFARGIILLFTKDDLDLLGIGIFALRIQVAAIPCLAAVVCVNSLCSALGKSTGAIIISLARQGFCFFPILPLMTWRFGVYGLAAMQGVADVLSLVVAVPFAVALVRLLIRLKNAQETDLEQAPAP